MAKWREYAPVMWDEYTYSNFIPKNNYWSFKVKATAANEFEQVNRAVETVCNDIDTIQANLRALRSKFGKYDRLNDEMELLRKALMNIRSGICQYNRQLIQGALDCCDSISQTDSKFFSQTNEIRENLNKIEAFGTVNR